MNGIELLALRGLRQTRGWSQEKLGELSGVAERSIRRIESGQAARGSTAVKLAAALNVSVAELCGTAALEEHSERESASHADEDFDRMRVAQLDRIARAIHAPRPEDLASRFRARLVARRQES